MVIYTFSQAGAGGCIGSGYGGNYTFFGGVEAAGIGTESFGERSQDDNILSGLWDALAHVFELKDWQTVEQAKTKENFTKVMNHE